MTQPNRKRLPDRRESYTERVIWAERGFYITVGFEQETPDQPADVFYGSGLKEGTDLRAMAHDACVLISILLQADFTPAMIAHSLAEAPDPVSGSIQPTSMVGAIVAALLPKQAAGAGE